MTLLALILQASLFGRLETVGPIVRERNLTNQQVHDQWRDILATAQARGAGVIEQMRFVRMVLWKENPDLTNEETFAMAREVLRQTQICATL